MIIYFLIAVAVTVYVAGNLCSTSMTEFKILYPTKAVYRQDPVHWVFPIFSGSLWPVGLIIYILGWHVMGKKMKPGIFGWTNPFGKDSK